MTTILDKAAGTVAATERDGGKDRWSLAQQLREIGERSRAAQLIEEDDPTIISVLIAEAEALLEGGNGAGPQAAGGRTLTLTPASKIEPERVRWALRSRVPLGSLTLLAGQPKLGKSTWALDLAARLSRGEAEGDLRGRPVASVILSYEDHPRATLVPRLLAAGADLNYVHLLSPTVTDPSGPDLVTLAADTERLAAECERVRARLLVVDPLMAALAAATDSHRDQDVRRVLAPLAQLAERLDLAALPISHTTKARDGDLIRRIGASVGLTGAARSLLVMGPDPTDPEGTDGCGRVLAHRGNLAGQVPALAYEIEPTVIEHHGERIETMRLVCTGESQARTEELLDPPEPEQRTERDDAADFLRTVLADGPRPARDVQAEAEEAGFSERTIRRAKSALDIEARRQSTGNQGGGCWVWDLPTQHGQPLTHTVGPLAEYRIESGIAASSDSQDGKAAKGSTSGEGGHLGPYRPRCFCATPAELADDGRCMRCWGWPGAVPFERGDT